MISELATIVNPNTDLAEVLFMLAAFAGVLCIVMSLVERKIEIMFWAGLIFMLLSLGLLFTA